MHAYEHICVAWRNALRFIWGVPSFRHNIVITLLSGSAPLSSELKARFLKCIYKALEHSNSTINQITKYACRNSISVCGTTWSDIVCKMFYVGMSVKEIYNDWYETLCNEEINCISLVNKMIDIREGRGSCDVFNIDGVLHSINHIYTN